MDKVNIVKIAEEAGTSIATVSRVLNNSEKVKAATRRKILGIIESTGYKPKVRKSRLTNISVVINEKKAFFSPFISEVLNGISDTIMSLGLEETITFVNNTMPPATILNMLRERRVDAAITFLTTVKTEFCELFHKEKFPFMALSTQNKKYNFIDTDNTTGIKNALEYLYSLGHRRFLYIMQDSAQHDYIERREAFLGFCEANNLSDQRVQILVDMKDPVYKNPLDSSYQIMRKMIREGLRETAVLTSHDLGAMGVLRACHEAGVKVPEDISVVGFDNLSETPYYDPPLTTISQNLYKMGAEAVFGLMQVLHSRSSGESARVQKVLPTELVIRRSTGPVKK